MNTEDTERLPDTVKAILRGERSGDLDEAESAAFEALLRDDPSARELLAQAEEELAAVATRFEPPELPASAWARVDAAVKAEAKQPMHQPVRRWRSAPVWLAACAAVLLVVGVFRGNFTAPDTSNGSPIVGTIVPAPTPPLPAALVVEALRPLAVEVVHGEEGLEFDESRFEAHVVPITFGEDTLVSIDVRDRTQ